jgi:hypothetical protein
LFDNDIIGPEAQYLSPTREFPPNATILRVAAKLTKTDLVSDIGSLDNDSLLIEDFTLSSMIRGSAYGIKCPPDPAQTIPKPKWDDGFQYILSGTRGQGVVSEFDPPEGGLNGGYYHNSSHSPALFWAKVDSASDKQQDFFWRFQVDYLDGRIEGLKESELLPRSLDFCDNVVPAVVPQEEDILQSEKSLNATYEVEQDGWFVSMTGFMQQGGSGIDIKLNGKAICTVKPIYGGPGGVSKHDNGTVYDIIKGMDFCTPFRVHKGDELFVVAKYDYTAHPV